MAAPTPLGLRRAVGLAEFTTWKVGGPAQWFAEPDSPEQLLELLTWALAEGIECRVIGAGSNLLVSDAGLAGLTLCNRRLQGAEIEVVIANERVPRNANPGDRGVERVVKLRLVVHDIAQGDAQSDVTQW